MPSAAKVCPSISGINHSTSVKTTTADSSSLPGLTLTAGFPSPFSPVSFWPTHKHRRSHIHTHSQLNLIWFIPLFSEGAEPRHLLLSPRLSQQGFTTNVLLFCCTGYNTHAHTHSYNSHTHTKPCVCNSSIFYISSLL